MPSKVFIGWETMRIKVVNTIFSAGLDVTADDPIAENNPLLGMNKVILTRRTLTPE